MMDTRSYAASTLRAGCALNPSSAPSALSALSANVLKSYPRNRIQYFPEYTDDRS